MIKRLFQKWQELLAPNQVIARELTIIRKLYEAELAQRKPPIYLITEDPGKNDTEVTYSDEEIKPRTAMHKLFYPDPSEDEDDED